MADQVGHDGELSVMTVEMAGVWLAGDTYIDKTDGYYTLVKGYLQNNPTAIEPMNAEIITWATDNISECMYHWELDVSGWPVLIDIEFQMLLSL